MLSDGPLQTTQTRQAEIDMSCAKALHVSKSCIAGKHAHLANDGDGDLGGADG